MLSAVELQNLRKKLGEYEGAIPHMYLDSKGLVTVGIGHLIINLQSAQKLPFITQKAIKATLKEIQVDYDLVKKQSGNMLASYYKRFTKLKLSAIEIDKLTNKHIDSFYKEIKQIYSDFDNFPSDVKLALLDLIFNVGMPDLKNNWPSLNKEVRAKEWGKAALHSNRKVPVSAARNKYVKDLFEKAESAKQVILKTKAS